jgi:hypothetical protein
VSQRRRFQAVLLPNPLPADFLLQGTYMVAHAIR